VNPPAEISLDPVIGVGGDVGIGGRVGIGDGTGTGTPQDPLHEAKRLPHNIVIGSTMIRISFFIVTLSS